MRSCLAAFWSIIKSCHSILRVVNPPSAAVLVTGLGTHALRQSLVVDEALHVSGDGLLRHDGEVWTAVRLASVDPSLMVELVTDAWRRTAPRRLAVTFDAGRAAATGDD